MTRRTNPENLDGRQLLDQVDADAEPAEVGLRRGNLLIAVVGVVFVLAVASGAVVINRAYPPPSPPNTATQQQLRDLRADLNGYLAGRGGLRDQQYAKTVHTLCELARTVGDTQVLRDPEYDCASVLAAPAPTVPKTTPPVTTGAPSTATGATTPGPARTAASPSTSAAGPSASPSPTSPGASPTPTPTRTTRPPGAPTASPAPILSSVLCGLPVLNLCPTRQNVAGGNNS